MLKVNDGYGKKWEYHLEDDFIERLYEQECVLVPYAEHMKHTATIHDARELLPFLEEECETDEELRFLEDVKGFDEWKSLYFERTYLKFGFQAPILEYRNGMAIVCKKKGKVWSSEKAYPVELSDKAMEQLQYLQKNDLTRGNWANINVTQDDVWIVTYIWISKIHMIDSW